MINTLYYILKNSGSGSVETLLECEAWRVEMVDDILKIISEIDFCKNEIEITDKNSARLFMDLG